MTIRPHRPQTFISILLIAFFCGPSRADDRILKIPIAQSREAYYHVHEDGAGVACGAYLVGTFPVFKNYTNALLYGLQIDGLNGSSGIRSWEKDQAQPGENFKFIATFSGRDGGFTPDLDCSQYLNSWQNLPEWFATITNRGPNASFTNHLVSGTPGAIDFKATSTEPEGDVMSHEWSFGDGAKANADLVVHHYSKPGNFQVSLKATDSDGLTNMVTKIVSVPAPKPFVSVQLFTKNSRSRVELEEEFGVRVTVRASDDGMGDLTDLAFTTDALTIPDLFKIVSAPAQTQIGTLSPGTKQEFNWTLKAEKVGDFALIGSAVSGKDAIGRPVSGVRAVEEGEVTALIVEIEQRPKQVLLSHDNNNDGATNELDMRVELILSVTNVSNVEITDVHTTETNEPIHVVTLASEPGLYLQLTNGAAGVFGTIAPKKGASITNIYTAVDRVYAEATAVVHGKAAGVPVEAAGKGTVNVGGGKLIEARFGLQEDQRVAGKAVRVYGSIKNVSRLKSREGNVVDEGKTVGVVVFPTIRGNGGGGYIAKAFSGPTPTEPRGLLLKPGESIDIEGVIPTVETPNDRALDISYEVAGFVHGEGPESRRALPTEIEVVSESDDKGNLLYAGSWHLNIPGTPDEPDPPEACPLSLSAIAYIPCVLGDRLYTTLGGLKDLLVLSVVGGGQALVRMCAYQGYLEAERAAAMYGDPEALDRMQAKMEEEAQSLDAVGWKIFNGIGDLGPSIDTALRKFDRDRREGGLKFLAGQAVGFVAENPDMAFEAWVTARAYKAIAGSAIDSIANVARRTAAERATAELAKEVEEFAIQRSISELPKSRKLRNGINVLSNPQIWRDAFGVSRGELEALLEIARKERLIIAFRSRSPRAAELIEDGLALLKSHGVDIKTVNEIDRLFLGYPDEFDSLCVLMDPPIPYRPAGVERDALVEAYLDRFPQLKGSSEFSTDLRGQVRARLTKRLDEFPEQLQAFSRYADEGIDVGFATEKQFGGKNLYKDAKEYLLNKKNIRKAEIEPRLIPAGAPGEVPRRAFILKMEKTPGSGVFLPITGDIDLMGIFRLDGTLPSALKRLRIYDLLREAGAQHGEPFTFFDAKKRLEYLSCCSTEGGETMLAVTPSAELITTQYADNLSTLPGGENDLLKVGTGDDPYVFLTGLGGELVSTEGPVSIGGLKAAASGAAPYVSVSAVARLAGELEAKISRSEGSATRVGPDGQLETYVPNSSGSPSPRPINVRGTSAYGPAILRNSIHALAQENPVLTLLRKSLEDVVAAGYIAHDAPPGALGGQWRATTADQLRAGAPPGSGVKLAPYTYLLADVNAGETVLPAFAAEEITGQPASEFFAVGDTVVIDPGGLSEEIATLVSVQPLTVSRPLRSAKDIGTTILFLVGTEHSASLPGALPSPENLLVWLRADAGLTLNDNTVVSWADQSANNFVFAAQSNIYSPTWISNSLGGLPAVRFSSALRQRLVANLNRTLTNATIFTLARHITTGSATEYIYSFGTPNFSGLMMTLGRQNRDDAYHYDGAAARLAPNTVAGTNLFLFTQTYGADGPDSHLLARDSETIMSTRTTTGRGYSAIATNVSVGSYLGQGNFCFTGELVEWIVYDRALSAAERLVVEEYLRQKAGLQAAFVPSSLELSSWEAISYDTGGSSNAVWNLDLGERVATLTNATDPTMLLSPFSVTNQEVNARIGSDGSNGFFGLVLGYKDLGDFVLFDWNRTPTNHPAFGVAPSGMRLRSFHVPAGTAPTASSFWSSIESAEVSNLSTNNVPWSPGKTYEIHLAFLTDRGELEILDGTNRIALLSFPNSAIAAGRIGFYDYQAAGAHLGELTLPGTEPILVNVSAGADVVDVKWINGQPPFVIEGSTDLGENDWFEIAPATPNNSARIKMLSTPVFLRVRSAGPTPR